MIEFLYENIGSKIKTLAKWMFLVETVSFILTGIILASEVDILYIFLVIAGPIIAWISTWVLYAFGQLVEDNERLRKHFVRDENSPLTSKNNSTKKYNKNSSKKSVNLIDDENSDNQAFSLDENDFIDIQCPHCGEQLSFLKDETNAICPNCEHQIKIK